MTTPHTTILVIEDDEKIRQFLKVGFENNGYRYFEAESAQQGLEKVSSVKPDMIILDLGLPDQDGMDVLKILREQSKTPVLILTARGKEEEKIQALDLGADDYLTKPFGIGELLARIRVVQRHYLHQIEKKEDKVFDNGTLHVNFEKRLVLVKGQEVRLTPIEYKLLSILAKNPDKVLTQKYLLKEIWGAVYTEQGHYLRVHMHQLRHKLEENPARPRFLITEAGVGYRMKMS